MVKEATVTTPSDTAIEVTRSFDAPAQLVFDFHTKPELVSQWLLGSPGFTMPVCEIDLRVGGKYHYVWRSDERDMEFGVHGVYTKIEAPHTIEHVESFDGTDGKTQCRFRLREESGRTTLVYFLDFGSRAARDQALESGMTDGMGRSFDWLEEILLKHRSG